MKPIPPKTTSLIQPLDVYFFRLWKVYVRTISDHIICNDLDISLQKRNNIIKLQSLVHFQLSAPRYIDMIKYSWFKSGYTERRGDRFETPNEYCFHHNMNDKECLTCLAENVVSIPFSRCSYCEQFFCFKHFFGSDHNLIDYHTCYA